jgi:hypothetical protein
MLWVLPLEVTQDSLQNSRPWMTTTIRFRQSLGRKQYDAAGVPTAVYCNLRPTPISPRSSLSPVDPSMPLFPSDGSPRHGLPTHYGNQSRSIYHGYNDSRPGGDLPLLNPRSNTASPGPRYDYQQYSRTGSPHSNVTGFRQQNNPSPWQRGAGYEG